jgi:AraC family transcriptional regulator
MFSPASPRYIHTRPLTGGPLSVARSFRLRRTFDWSQPVLARVNNNTASYTLDDRRLQRVLQFVDDNLQNPIALKDLAAVANLSPFYFSRAFRNVTGNSPQRFVRARRLEKAKEFLADGGMSLADIALICNFSSQSSFTRAFTRVLGISPGQYRENCGHRPRKRR